MVSIIVAVYNIEEFVSRCIESLLKQTYYNIEIILVDDGSTDESGTICDDYQKKDNRIRVVHKQNGGLSDARNAGIELATGDYYIFVDGDDWIHKDTIATLVKVAQAEDAEIVQSDFSIVSNSININEERIILEKEDVAIFDKDHYLDYSIIVAWSKLYKAELWKNIRFPKGRLHEDEFVFHRIVFGANKICIVKKKLFYYFQREDSIMHKISEKNYFDAVDAYIDRVSFCRAYNWESGLLHALKFGTMYILDSFNNNYELDRDIQKRVMHKWRQLIKFNVDLHFLQYYFLSFPLIYKIYKYFKITG